MTSTPIASTSTAPHARGPASEVLLALLTGDPRDEELHMFTDAVDRALEAAEDVVADEDLQLVLYLLYLLHYGPAPFVHGEWEWHPALLEARGRIEQRFEESLRAHVALPSPLPTSGTDIAEVLFAMTSGASEPALALWTARHATEEQMREFLIHRSLYTLREADPHSWAIPRLRGRAKAALVEIQSDEYGGGRPERVHAEIFARTLRHVGLDDTPDAYLDLVPAPTLASLNVMSMFGLQRRLRGAIVGHLAAFEMTSSIPNRHYGRAFRRLGYGTDVTWYFDEHVEADAVHEQIAGRDLAGGLADDAPELIPDILFGAAACLWVDDRAGDHMLDSWSGGRTSLRGAAT